MADKLLGMLGLARRAGQVQSGSEAVRKSLEKRQARVVILACDASSRTVRMFSELALESSIPLFVHGQKEELGRLVGKPSRSVIAVTDDSFAKGVVKVMERGEV